MPIVSVIVPVFRVEMFLSKCIDSILAQTFTDFEVILVDDGSPDNCGAICDEYASRDHRIKVIHKSNGGLSDARNAGLDVATGEFICFVDSDDWIEKDLLQDNITLLQQANADMVIFNYQEVYKDNTLLQYRVCSSANYDKAYYFFRAPVMVWCKLYRADMWKQLRFPVGLKHEDDYVMPYLVAMCDNIICNDKSYYNYNKLNDHSIMFNDNEVSKFTYFICAMQRLKVAEEREHEFFAQALIRAFNCAFKAWNCDTMLHILNVSEKETIINFFNKYISKKHLLPFYLKLYLWGYEHCSLINKIKGLYYIKKYRLSHKRN